MKNTILIFTAAVILVILCAVFLEWHGTGIVAGAAAVLYYLNYRHEKKKNNNNTNQR